MQWQVVIPMSGFGERFRRAGYTVPKPLIEVDGKPIIAHVLDLFPGETDVHFICNQEHLSSADWDMRGTLQRYCPTGCIHAIAPHKLGPVNAVAKIIDQLDRQRPVALSYCDFSGHWDWQGFKRFMADGAYNGAVICYTGFHPHMLSCFRYAYCKTEEGGNRVLAIQEKQPYTDTPMREWASCGIYCFGSGEILARAIRDTMTREDLKLNGEYYASLAYRPLLEHGADIRVYPMEQFCQWGTPEDLAQWNAQIKALRLSNTGQKRPRMGGATMLPMVGMGSRFAREGYSLPKPLIQVDGSEMWWKAWKDLPETPDNVFVLRRDMAGAEAVAARIEQTVCGARIKWLDTLTDGQARTCLLAMDCVDEDKPLTIGACDNGLRYDVSAFERMWNAGPDVIVWGMRGYPGAVQRPTHYGWIDADSHTKVRGISVKKPLSDPRHEAIVTGAFTFRRAGDFAMAAQRMIDRNRAVNNEFYVDECINDAIAMGLDVRVFDVDAYLCWGTPDDLRTWEYWQRFFNAVSR